MSISTTASAREVQRILDLVAITGSAGQTPTQIAHIVGPPVTAAIVKELMRGRVLCDATSVTQLVVDAKRRAAVRFPKLEDYC